MLLQILIPIIIFFSISHGSYETVRIGKIDDYYKNKISQNELRSIIEEIESQFESQLGFDVFGYASTGKSIDILYLPPLQLEKRLHRKKELLEKKEQKLHRLESEINDKETDFTSQQDLLNKEIETLNKETKALNDAIKKINKKADLTKEEYLQVKKKIQTQQKILRKKRVQLQKKQNRLQRSRTRYNQKVITYNRIITEYNFLRKEIIRLSRNIKKVQGRTFGIEEIFLKISYKNGKKIREKNTKKSMNRIEIYGFKNRNHFKAVLAHEIGHLVGIPHIADKNSLMNPLLQENQIQNLYLNEADIRNFEENF